MLTLSVKITEMSIFPRQKYFVTIIGLILVILVLLVFVLNVILGNFIEKKLNRTIFDGNAELYNLSVEKVQSNILLGSLRISNIQLKPDSALLINARESTSKNPLIFNVNITEVHLVGINLLKAITTNFINVSKITFENPQISILQGEKPQLIPENTNTPKSGFNLDSLQINGISGFALDRTVLNQVDFTYIDLLTSDTLLSNSMALTELRDLELKRISDIKNLFKLDLNKLTIDVNNESMVLHRGDYQLSLKHLNLSTHEGELVLNDLKIKPRDNDLYRFAQKLHYTSEIYNIDVSKIHLKNINLVESINHGSFFIDTLLVSGLNLSILMDKNYPFNTEKRPLLPNQLLKNMKLPIHIGNLQIEKSNLLYQEKLPDIDEPMTASLNNLNIDISRVTSIKDSLQVRKNMRILLQSDFMKKAKMRIEFVFPLYMEADTFFYAGSLGSANLKLFNKATLPALGAWFTEGELESIQFKGSANNSVNTGEMIMLYNNLKAEISRKDYKTKNNILSWAANAALHNANPGKNGKTRVAIMNFEKVPHKGFGNFMWKTLEHGIISTVLPTGKTKKVDNNDKKTGKKK